MFIVFEGIDGSGKTTLIKELHKKLSNKKKKVLLTREPGGTNSSFSENIREIIFKYNKLNPITELFLFIASRIEHVEKVLIPNIKENIVLCDRYYFSNIAYQANKTISRSYIEKLNIEALSVFENKEILSPNLVVFFLVKDEKELLIVLNRKNKANLNRLDKKEINFYINANKNYLNMVKYHNEFLNSNNILVLNPLNNIDHNVRIVLDKILSYENL